MFPNISHWLNGSSLGRHLFLIPVLAYCLLENKKLRLFTQLSIFSLSERLQKYYGEHYQCVLRLKAEHPRQIIYWPEQESMTCSDAW